MNALSQSRLAGLHPRVAACYAAADTALCAQGIEILLVSGLRTAAEQNLLYSYGRGGGGQVVTNARAGQSMHNYGLAFDCIPYLPGSTTQLNWKANTPQFQAMVAAMKQQGLEWGGDWKGDLGDFDHFQLPGLPASPSPAMEEAYTGCDGDLTSIWSRVEAGDFCPPGQSLSPDGASADA